MHPQRIALAFALVLLPACTADDGGGDTDADDATSAEDGTQDSGDDPRDDDGPEDDEAATTNDGPGTSGDTPGTTGDEPGTTDGEPETSDDDAGPQAACPDGPLAAPIAGCAPASPPSTGDPHQDCVDRINQLRWECQCLPPLARWTEAESCTDEQSGADQSGGGAHANFGDCNEYGQNTCPDWGSNDDIISGCLQSMWDEGPGEPFSAHGHYINMTNPDYTKVACGFSNGGGGVWSNQNFSG